jgi:hypothetical protein
MPIPQRVTIDAARVQRAINNLAPFFQLTTPQLVSETIALQSITGLGDVVPNSTFRPSRNVALLIDTLLNTTEGGIPVLQGTVEGAESIVRKLQEYSTPTGPSATDANSEELRRFASLFKIYHGGPEIATPTTPDQQFAFAEMDRVLGSATSDEIRKKLSVLFINTPQISPTQRNTEAITIFLNGIPTTELSRAVPYVNIQFLFGRPALDADNRLNALSIYKLLEGAVSTSQNATTQLLSRMNTVQGRIEGAQNGSGWLSTAGMELFQTPHTMVNGDEPLDGNSSLRTTPVRDKFRPFLTFKSLNIDVAPSIGFFSNKTAKLDFVLHDISRLHEIADFIRPDMYGSSELFIEYGWTHPDSGDNGNFYADIMNYSRCKEKYGIRNVTMNMDEQRQANITLDLYMKGSNDFSTETIATLSNAQNDLLRTIETISEEVQRLRGRIQGNTNTSATPASSGGSGGRTREIRGIQFLDGANDWRNNINLSPGQLTQYRQLLTALQARGNISRDSQALSANLRTLFGTLTGTGPRQGAVGEQGAQLQLRNSIATQIGLKMREIGTGNDPFLPNLRIPDRNGNLIDARNVERGSNRTNNRADIQEGTVSRDAAPPPIPTLASQNVHISQNVSLAKLLALFVGVPLASKTDNPYYDIQFLFYPFNKYAGFANGINTGQFIIDTKYFYEQYVKFRTENVGRSANVSLRDFTSFLGNVMIDDPVAAAYGLDSLYERVYNRETRETSYRPSGTTIAQQAKLEQRLLGQTPDGSFRMPQITFYVEALPLRMGGREGVSSDPDVTKTILRIHVFDKQTTAYEGQSSLLNASRENVLAGMQNIPSQPEGEPVILAAHRASFAQVLEAATNGPSAFLRRATVTDPSAPGAERTTYVVDGGPEAIQEFVMKTMPYIIYGAQGTGVKTAQLATMQDAALSTVNMLRSGRTTPLRANGEQPGGLPMRMIPVELSMSTLGCSLISFTQQFFIKFGTGTTADNIYGVNGLSHKLEPGVFETDIKFVPLDAYGRYTSFIDRINQVANHLDDIHATSSPSNLNR